MCWSLIAVLQFLLQKSQHDSGIIFAPRISDLPLSRTFLYLYFPTVLAVIFSMYWAWIDLDTKRMEPYYQLSKDEGALGRDSLLLQYPFDFLPLVPMKAAKDRLVEKPCGNSHPCIVLTSAGIGLYSGLPLLLYSLRGDWYLRKPVYSPSNWLHVLPTQPLPFQIHLFQL